VTAFETAVWFFVSEICPVVLVGLACLGWTRQRRGLTLRRRLMFLLGIGCAGLAWVSHFAMNSYLSHAHLEYWAETNFIVRWAFAMGLVAILGIIGVLFGRGGGRIAGIAANILNIVLWFLSSLAAT